MTSHARLVAMAAAARMRSRRGASGTPGRPAPGRRPARGARRGASRDASRGADGYRPGSVVLGRGGYGVVVQNASRAGVAHKLLLSHVQCAEAKREFQAQTRVYRVLRDFLAARPALRGRVAVPRPAAFSPCGGQCRGSACACGPPYHCMFSMERVRSGRADGIMRHVLLNSDFAFTFGKIQFVSRNAPTRAHTNVLNAGTRARDGPRGAFLGPPQLRQAGMDPGALAEAMGVLHQVIVTAGLTPLDVEYVLGVPPGRTGSSPRDATCLYAMDFGMAGGDFDPELDMYVPQPDDPALHARFVAGRAAVRDWARARR